MRFLPLWLGAVAVIGAGWLFLDPLHECGRHRRFETILFRHGPCSSLERYPLVILKTIASAQHDFRVNDRDGDKVNQFWRADVAGLYALAPGGGPAIRLIESSTAAADDRPVSDWSAVGARSPRLGYWFRAIRHADEDPKALDPNRFAHCAFPDTPGAGKYLFIIDDNNTIFRALADGRRGIDMFPTGEELKRSWSKAD